MTLAFEKGPCKHKGRNGVARQVSNLELADFLLPKDFEQGRTSPTEDSSRSREEFDKHFDRVLKERVLLLQWLLILLLGLGS